VYPQPELDRLAAHKIWLRRRIVRRRGECATAAAQLARPVAWLDRVVAFWRRLSPLAVAAVPLGLLVQRTFFPRMKIFGALLRWAPLLFNLLRRAR